MGTELSPSGRYRLAVASDDHWRSTGVITRESDGKEIATVNRNYCAFPALWIEGHANGHDYLLCGEDYQGHTVIELDTGKRRDTLMEGTEPHGHGFCMAEARYEPSWKVVIVSGCIWAAPYEYRLYDYSDPLAAGPQLEMKSRPDHEDDAWAEDDSHWPEIEGDLIRFFQSPRVDDDSLDEDEEKKAQAASPPAAIKTFRRIATDVLMFVSETTTPEEAEKRRQHEEARARFDAKMEAFRANDPLYLLYVKLLEDPIFVPDSHSSYGVTYHSENHTWCPVWKGDETRWCRRIMTAGRCIVDLEWAIETGPIKVIVYVDHNETESVFFPHSLDGMEEAFDHAKARIKEVRQ